MDDKQNSRGTVNHAEGAKGHPDALSKDISIPKNRGVGGRDSVPDAVPPWPKAGHEKILFESHAKKHNCWIVLGRDRWGNQSMGKSMEGGTRCGAIDLVVGRMSWEPDSEVHAQPMFGGGDAARVYISQRADVDRYFKLREVEPSGFWGKLLAKIAGGPGALPNPNDLNPPVPRSVDRSCVGIRADAVRIIGQEGVKIVTKSGTKMNSWKNPVIGNPGIDLCAGDDPNTLQPMVMGLHMVSAMRETHDIVQNLLKIFVDLSTTLANVCVATATHTHPVAIPVTGPETSASMHMDQMISIIQEGLVEASGVKKRLKGLDQIYFKPAGEKCITSPHNKTN